MPSRVKRELHGLQLPDGGGGGVLPYISHTGACHPSGYGFVDHQVINGVSNSKISKILYKQGFKAKHFDKK